MAHSKRNTSLPHFTSYERNLLRSTWGTKRSVIGRDSFLPFASCRLCLQPARAPVVACASNGDLFCRECAINDLLAQRQEIKRLEKDREEARKRIAEDEERMLEEARKKDLRDFELVSMGLDAARSGAGRKRKAEEEEERALAAFKAREVEVNGVRKKVFELDEKEMARVAREERERLMSEIKKEKDSNKSALPSFWVPSLTPSTDHDEITANKAVKLTPMCPGSTETHKHSYSLKSLVDVHFTEEKAEDGTVSRVCPSCKKNLSNGLKAMLTKPCGHVICSPCVGKFMTPHDVPDPHTSKEEQAKTAALHGLVLCYVCETDVTPIPNGDATGSKKKSKKKEKDTIQPGLVEISSEGTGFAGGGGNVATKTGVAFQC
ncbi:Nitric oxide synthase-interacting protein [Penicillium rolfsii]|nr:Nitric oxide synthase-interacting protein [Penicillium rolfsii]